MAKEIRPAVQANLPHKLAVEREILEHRAIQRRHRKEGTFIHSRSEHTATMGKKKPDPSLQGKKPANRSAVAKKKTQQRNPSHIRNKLKRTEMYGKYLQNKRTRQKEERLQREKEAEALGEEVVKKTPRTIDNARVVEPTMVAHDDPEVAGDEADDEFSPYFSQFATPKVLITTRPRPSQQLFYFIADLQKLIPGLHFYPRKSYAIRDICRFAANRDFTHLIVLSEKSKVCNGMTISHLAGDGTAGPTAFFKLTNVVTSQNIPNHGASTSHIPELNLHGFGTRLGHRVGRLLGSLFPIQGADFRGRQVVTFHNQRDYIFVRHHRYIFRPNEAKETDSSSKKKPSTPKPLDTTTAPTEPSQAAKDLNVKTKLQELGPRFTLKLRWLQEGTFDTQTGEYEFLHKRKEMDTSRRKFHL